MLSMSEVDELQFREWSSVLNNNSLFLCVLRDTDVSKLAAARTVNCRICFTSGKVCILSTVIDCLPTFHSSSNTSQFPLALFLAVVEYFPPPPH